MGSNGASNHSVANDPPTARPRRARIEDVAQAAAVSVATVSRALRGLPNVAESTRARVVEVAQQLQYEPDPAAARLAAGRTKTVLVVVPHLASWYFSTVIAGAEAVCNESGYEFLVVGVGSQTECDRLLHERSRLERRADGVVLVNIPATASQAASLRERGVSLATIGTKAAGAPSVFIDDVEVGRLAAATLADLGHERIALISGRGEDPLNFEVPKRRAAGFLSGLRERGLTFDRRLEAGGNFGIDGGQEAMSALLDADEVPTAVFAMSDEMAFGALMELKRRGLRPGHDVSILGVDDHDFARVVELSTIRQQVSAQGAAAARSLILAMTNAPVSLEPQLSSIELVLRATTGPPPPDA
ncbi:MAG TPA: LacI family DNA-binding transcriptional regulator [Ilumatobacteraceae bacterium]|nr:LacI family DNA-binding transcriptional regulator [Ilumatobacteraceae bacterium]